VSLASISLTQAQYELTASRSVCDSYRGGIHDSKGDRLTVITSGALLGTDTGPVGVGAPTGPSLMIREHLSRDGAAQGKR
jgi:hypothetical protein